MMKLISNIKTLICFLLFFITVLAEAQVNPKLYFDAGNGFINLNQSDVSHNIFLTIPATRLKNRFVEKLRMDSIISSSVTGGSSKVSFEYNNNDDITEQLIQYYDAGIWVNDLLDEFVYDSNGYLTQDLSLGWNSSSWDSLNRINYTYNIQGYVSQYVLQSYNEGDWLNVSRVTYDYDSTGNEISSLSEVWQDTSWQNSLIVYTYYSGLNKKDSILFNLWNFNHWENYFKTIFYYDEQTSFLDSLIGKVWNGNNWQNHTKRTVENDINGNQIMQVDEDWNGVGWENSVRRFYTYNGLNYIENAYCQLWINNNWVDGDDAIVIANPDGYIIGFITHNIDIYYKTSDVSDDNINSGINNFILEQNYPNPFNPSTKIKFLIPNVGRRASSTYKTVLKVYDVLGNEIATLVNKELPAGNYEIEFNAANLPSGVYFYRLTAGSFSQTKKMILLR